MIEFKCTLCGADLKIPDSSAGKHGRCSQCQAPIDIPPLTAPAPNPAEPPTRPAPPEPSKTAPPSPPSRIDQEAAGSTDFPARIPFAQPVDSGPFWRKVLIGSIGGAAVILAIILLAPMVTGNPDEPTKTYNKARDLSKQASDRTRSVRRIVTGAEVDQLFAWKALLTEADGKFDELLELKAENDHEEELLTKHQKEVARDKKDVSKRIEELDDELWPVVKTGDEPKDMFPRISSAVPIVQLPRSSGSGFLTRHEGKLWVATNRHVVEGVDHEGLKLVFLLGAPDSPSRHTLPIPRRAAIEMLHRQSDLAVISVPETAWLRDFIKKKKIRPIKLSSPQSKPVVTDKIWTIGHPGGHVALTATVGDVTAIKREYYGGRHYRGKILQIGADISSGSSGCPILDKHGRVVGLATFLIRTPQGEKVKYAIHVDALRKLLSDPKTRLSLEEAQRYATVAKAYKEYSAEMEADGWRPCDAPEVRRESIWSDGADKSVNYRTWMFKASPGTRYVVMAVSDPNYPIRITLGSSVALSAEGTGKVTIPLALAGDEEQTVTVTVSDPKAPKSEQDWPTPLGVFRRGTTGPTPSPR